MLGHVKFQCCCIEVCMFSFCKWPRSAASSAAYPFSLGAACAMRCKTLIQCPAELLLILCLVSHIWCGSLTAHPGKGVQSTTCRSTPMSIDMCPHDMCSSCDYRLIHLCRSSELSTSSLFHHMFPHESHDPSHTSSVVDSCRNMEMHN